MPRYGHARVASTDQDLTLQRGVLPRAGCVVVCEEKVPGASRQRREELRTLLSFLRAGDELVVTRVDRLARSVGDLPDIVREFRARDVALVATEQPVDTSTAAGTGFLDMPGVSAAFETDLRRERPMEGIAKAKARGVYEGHKPAVDADRVRGLRARKPGPVAIAAQVGASRSTAWRVLEAG